MREKCKSTLFILCTCVYRNQSFVHKRRQEHFFQFPDAWSKTTERQKDTEDREKTTPTVTDTPTKPLEPSILLTELKVTYRCGVTITLFHFCISITRKMSPSPPFTGKRSVQFVLKTSLSLSAGIRSTNYGFKRYCNFSKEKRDCFSTQFRIYTNFYITLNFKSIHLWFAYGCIRSKLAVIISWSLPRICMQKWWLYRLVS